MQELTELLDDLEDYWQDLEADYWISLDKEEQL